MEVFSIKIKIYRNFVQFLQKCKIEIKKISSFVEKQKPMCYNQKCNKRLNQEKGDFVYGQKNQENVIIIFVNSNDSNNGNGTGYNGKSII